MGLRNLVSKIEVKTSLRANKCKFNAAHKIPKGDLRLVVTPLAAVKREYGYCVDCGVAMLEAAQTNIAENLAALRRPTQQ